MYKQTPQQWEETMTLKAWFDGACWPNSGGYASYGAVIWEGDRIRWKSAGLVVPELNPDTK